MLKRFNKIFGIHEPLEQEKKRFVQRINQTIFREVENFFEYDLIFSTLCFRLGEDVDEKTSEARLSLNTIIMPKLRSLTYDDFYRTLQVVCLLYQYFSDNNKNRQKLNSIDKSIKMAFSLSGVDLGIKWSKGMFYPSGAKNLDERLIEDPFDWLEDYPDEKRDFLGAIAAYTNKNLGEVVINCYLVVEGLVRAVLKNKKVLENNKEELFKNIDLSQEWKSILDKYISFANEFKRHASNKRHKINPLEVEAFLYFTGLLVRLIIQSKK